MDDLLRRCGPAAGQRGAAAVEVAIVTPFCLALLVMMIGVFGASVSMVQADNLAAVAARAAGRGESESAIAERIAAAAPSAVVALSVRGLNVCAEVRLTRANVMGIALPSPAVQYCVPSPPQ